MAVAAAVLCGLSRDHTGQVVGQQQDSSAAVRLSALPNKHSSSEDDWPQQKQHKTRWEAQEVASLPAIQQLIDHWKQTLHSYTVT